MFFSHKMKRRNVSPMVRTYGIEASNKSMDFLIKGSHPGVSSAMKALVEKRMGEKIRKVVGYQEHIESSGGCETCSFDEIVVDVVFKSIEGHLCMVQFQESLASLISALVPGDNSEESKTDAREIV